MQKPLCKQELLGGYNIIIREHNNVIYNRADREMWQEENEDQLSRGEATCSADVGW